MLFCKKKKENKESNSKLLNMFQAILFKNTHSHYPGSLCLVLSLVA